MRTRLTAAVQEKKKKNELEVYEKSVIFLQIYRIY